MLDQHPHAAAVLGAALDGRPAHAYLLHGPAGTGKRAAARDFAAALLARDSAGPGLRAHARAARRPSRSDLGRAQRRARDAAARRRRSRWSSAASHTPFESTHRVFVLERADTMNDEAANALLKTLEEPPPYVVLLLLTDSPSQVLPTISSRCQPVRFDPLPAGRAGRALQARGIDPETATACARLSLGDGERALTLALTPELRARAEAFARAPLHGRAHAEHAWRPLLEQARGAGAAAKQEVEAALAEELEFLPKKEHRRRETEFTERARRAERRAMTGALDHALQLVGLWYRDLACVAAGAEDLVHHSDRLEALREDAALREAAAWRAAVELVDDTRAGLALNVSEELALEALAYRLES